MGWQVAGPPVGQPPEKGNDVIRDRTEDEEKQHDKGLEQAKKRAEWELGDRSWAGIIIGAYLYPEQDAEMLEKEKEKA